MLTHIAIRDFAIVERLELDLAGGMTVLTGETGAGKSILVDAVGLVLGDRADATVVRHGADRAEVSAAFDLAGLPAVAGWLAERELDEDGECLVRRTVSTEGRSRGYVNGRPVPAQVLRELGERLVDIHGQHAHQSLLRREVQRALLDDYAGNAPLLAEVAERHAALERARAEHEALRRAADDRQERLDLLRYQVGELEALDPKAGEVSELEAEREVLANASRLMEAANLAVDQVYAADASALALLTHAQHALTPLKDLDPRLAGAVDLIDNAVIQTEEAAGELRGYLADLELDPERLDHVEGRLDAMATLARKHRVETQALPEVLERLRGEVADLTHADERLGELEAAVAAVERAYGEAAGRLSAARREGAKALAERVTDNMQRLGMPGGRFEVALEPLERPSPHGMERIELRVTANPGQPPRALAKVASGGELSRIALSLQVLISSTAQVPTLVFDEVDVGIGGGTAEVVGQLLRRLGAARQVLCVTHLPQVAAQGHQHLQVTKTTDGATTRTAIQALAAQARVDELARMLGGVEITRQTRAHAREMMERAQAG